MTVCLSLVCLGMFDYSELCNICLYFFHYMPIIIIVFVHAHVYIYIYRADGIMSD